MAAVTRWNEYPVSRTSYMASSYVKGQRGYKDSTSLSPTKSTFTINGSQNQLHLQLDGAGSISLTLASGTDLDGRFVAKDITEQLHTGSGDKYELAQCEWGCLPGPQKNGFRIYSGKTGSGSAVTVSSGVNTAHIELGFSTGAGTGGSNTSMGIGAYNFNGSVLVSGTWHGFWDETYMIMIADNADAGDPTANGIDLTPTQGGSNAYAGTMTVGGIYSDETKTADTYQIHISTANGTTVGAGAGSVPQYMISTHANDNNPGAYVDILYADYWYPVGTQGVKVRWEDAVFNTVADAWTIDVEASDNAEGSNSLAPIGTAKYVWASNRGDDSGDIPVTTASGGYTQLGSRGLYITFSGSTWLKAGEVYYVMCQAPQPSSYNITQLNYGNVTVSTDSPVKTVAFEIMSGAEEISSVKFGLQSHGSFSYHDGANTKFRFGTVGPTNTATDPVSSTTGLEWWPDVASTDIDSDVPPGYLYATEDDLSVVASADLSEDVGSQQTYLQSDPIWLCILLGANETGANSTINYRLYFDYS